MSTFSSSLGVGSSDQQLYFIIELTSHSIEYFEVPSDTLFQYARHQMRSPKSQVWGMKKLARRKQITKNRGRKTQGKKLKPKK